MDRERAQVMFVGVHVFMHVCIFVCFFEDFSRLRLHPEPKVIPCSRVADNTLLRHIFRTMVFPARASWHVIVVPIGLTNGDYRQSSTWSLTQILRYISEELRRIRDTSLVDRQSAKKDAPSIRTATEPKVQNAKRWSECRLEILSTVSQWMQVYNV